MFAIAAETGWSEERVKFMPLARLAQYQHCLFRRNAVRTTWSTSDPGSTDLKEQLENLRRQWRDAHRHDSRFGLADSEPDGHDLK